MKYFLTSLLAGLLTAGTAAAQGTEYPAVKFRSNYLSSYYLSHAPTTTPWWPSWSPDGKWIAFSMYGSIWKVECVGEQHALARDRVEYRSLDPGAAVCSGVS